MNKVIGRSTTVFLALLSLAANAKSELQKYVEQCESELGFSAHDVPALDCNDGVRFDDGTSGIVNDRFIYKHVNGSVDLTALDQRVQAAQRVRVKSRAILRPNLNVDGDHVRPGGARWMRTGRAGAFLRHLHDRGVKHDGPAMRDAGLDDDIRPRAPDDLLHHQEIGRQLDDRPAEPLKLV